MIVRRGYIVAQWGDPEEDEAKAKPLGTAKAKVAFEIDGIAHDMGDRTSAQARRDGAGPL